MERLWRIDVLTAVINTVHAEKAAGSVFLNLASAKSLSLGVPILVLAGITDCRRFVLQSVFH